MLQEHKEDIQYGKYQRFPAPFISGPIGIQSLLSLKNRPLGRCFDLNSQALAKALSFNQELRDLHLIRDRLKCKTIMKTEQEIIPPQKTVYITNQQSRPPTKKKRKRQGVTLAKNLSLATLPALDYSKCFVIDGGYEEIRRNLLQRGWLEIKNKYSVNYDLKWTYYSKFNHCRKNSLLNHFKNIGSIATKENLAKNLKKCKKFDYSKFFPQCYNLISKSEKEDFIRHYYVNKAINILRNSVKDQEAHQYQLYVAIRIVGQYTDFLQGSLNDFKISDSDYLLISNSDIRYLRLIIKDTPPIPDIQMLKQQAQTTLQSLQDIDPQYNLLQTHNIWIIKPGKQSRGRNIKVKSNLQEILSYSRSCNRYICQKYIENPLLILNRKFDIRQWVLVTSIKPLDVWFFNECYLRFSSEDYDIENLENKFIHLTNNAVNKNSVNFNNDTINECMWDIFQFQQYLIKEYNEDIWVTKLRPQLEQIVVMSLKSSQQEIIHRDHSFELLGYDFMIDTDFSVWLIEVNTSPSMDQTTVIYKQKVTNRLVQEVLNDTLSVVLDHLPNPQNSTGKFSKLLTY